MLILVTLLIVGFVIYRVIKSEYNKYYEEQIQEDIQQATQERIAMDRDMLSAMKAMFHEAQLYSNSNQHPSNKKN